MVDLCRWESHWGQITQRITDWEKFLHYCDSLAIRWHWEISSRENYNLIYLFKKYLFWLLGWKLILKGVLTMKTLRKLLCWLILHSFLIIAQQVDVSFVFKVKWTFAPVCYHNYWFVRILSERNGQSYIIPFNFCEFPFKLRIFKSTWCICMKVCLKI